MGASMVIDNYEDDVLAERWDDAAIFPGTTRGTYTDYRTDPVIPRPYNDAEQGFADRRAAFATETTNQVTLTDRAWNAIQANRDYLALAPPTTAQVIAQVAALTRQNNALIRLVTHRLEETT
jgi:hypothetical protein